MAGMVDEKTLEIASFVKVSAFGPYETVHLFDTGKFFGSRAEYNKYLAGMEKKEAIKRAKKALKMASETPSIASSKAKDTDIEEIEEIDEDLDDDVEMEDVEIDDDDPDIPEEEGTDGLEMGGDD